MTPIIAIDGPAASGKGTLARGIAKHYDYAHLETGLLYRAIAQSMLEQNANITDTATLLHTAAKLDTTHLTSPTLHDKPIGEAASKIAQNAKLRQAILGIQRNFAKNPPNGKKGVVMDGRDIGTIICPDAEVKLFVTAKLETRAHRRFLEWQKQGKTISEAEVLAEIKERDRQDSERKTAPLIKSANAHLLDCSNLSIEAGLEKAIAIIEQTLG